MIVGLVMVGLVSHSLGVLAAGGDYAADATAIAVSLLALRISLHSPGHPKATTYAALINTMFMLAVTVIVIVEGVRRLLSHAPQIAATPVIVVSIIAVIVMMVGALILVKGAEENDLNMKAVLLDTVADAGSSAGVALSGLIILITHNYYWLDSTVAILIALIISYHALKLLKEVLHSLRPAHLSSKKVL